MKLLGNMEIFALVQNLFNVVVLEAQFASRHNQIQARDYGFQTQNYNSLTIHKSVVYLP